MPFANTWSEELVAEWFAIRGYLIETNVPTGSGGGGGRREADIIGVRIENSIVKGIHAEVGSFAENPQKVVERLKNKFEGSREMIKSWVKDRTGTDEIKIDEIVVTIWASDPVKDAIKRKLPNVKLIDFKELYNDVIKIVDEYVSQFKMFPANFWFLNFLWHVKYKEKKELNKVKSKM